MAMSTGRSTTPGRSRSYVREPVPVRFPEFAGVPESKRHLKQRTLLYQVLDLAFADRAAIGCDQFVYWDPTDPTQCLAPDAFVRLGVPDDDFRSWKVWERGAPDVAVEIISANDVRDRDWDDKLEKYRRLGVRELVRFDPEQSPASLRVWDSVEGDLVERTLDGPVVASECLPGHWLIVEDPANGGHVLRLARDADGRELYPSPMDRVRELEAALSRADRR